LAGGLLLTFLCCGSDWRGGPSFVAWGDRFPGGAAGPGLVWFAEHLRVFCNAGGGLGGPGQAQRQGPRDLLVGRVAGRRIWYYFPLALTMKLSVPFLFLPLLVSVVRLRSLGNWACLAACALLALSVTYRVQIGIRLILPVLGLAAIGWAAAVVNTCRWLAA